MLLFFRWYMIIFPFLVLLHVWVAPYTKVEESFNIQAIHDFLKYGVPVNGSGVKIKYLFDHMTFSGAVPRTFVGAISVAGLSKPLIWLGRLQGLSAQVTARGILGLANAAAWITFVRAIRKAYGERTAAWYTFIQVTQFHVFFYASRTLPNTFAFCLNVFASASFLPDPTSDILHRVRRTRRGFYLLTFAAVIFRSELALLVASQAGWEILKSHDFNTAYTFLRRVVIPSVLTAGLASILISVPLDTHFWQSKHWLLPELSAFLFNVFPKEHQGASAWGTSPWHWYFTSAIPRLVLNPGLLLLIPYGIFSTTQRRPVLDTLIPPLGYTAMYSILPHKETRFLFPIVPSLTLAIAISVSYLSLRRDTLSKQLTRAIIFTSTLTILIVHGIILPLSAQNYPGGHALSKLHAYHSLASTINNTKIHVHLTNLALQSGVTRFLEQPDPATQRWIYDKSPTPPFTSTLISDGTSLTVDLDEKSWSHFTYAVVEPSSPLVYSPQLTIDPSSQPKATWIPLFTVPSLRRDRPRILKPDAGRGCLVLCRDGQEKLMNDGLYILLRQMYGSSVAGLYGIVHDVVREGYGIPRSRSLTGGYWIDWRLEARLVVLGNVARMSTGVED